MLTEHSVTIETDASGDATVYVGPLRGMVHSLRYLPGTIDALANIAITGETSGKSVISITGAGSSNVDIYPRSATVDTSNSATTYAFSRIAIVNERIKIVVSGGGASKSGSMTFVIEED